ncbi:suppressor of cytokine signaling 7 [Eublepharis macularius]|uniref:Suppressor of cytokine signaling 7 n=1 Tax=Eublepharis macularius TaxID=481883 RepID=A0AA97LBK4_EUBMA|nr:suppressor of cytokine signaling 7 [Eublepharis macularius]
MQCAASLSAMQRAGGGGAAAAAAAAEPGGGGGGEAVAAAAASYRVLSRLLGYGGAESPAVGLALGGAVVETAATGAAGDRGRTSGLRGSQLLVFRPGEAGESSGGTPTACLPPPPPPPPPSELLCARHRCALLDAPKGDPGGGRCWSGAAGGLLFPPGAGLELQLAALGLHQAPSTAPAGSGKSPGDCPCLSLLPAPPLVPPPALPLLPPGEETSDALLVLEALGPDEEDEEEEAGQAESSSQAGTGGSRFQPPAPAAPVLSSSSSAAPPPAGPVPPTAAGANRPSSNAPSRKGSFKIRLSRLFRTKSCSGPSCNGAASSGARRAGDKEFLQAAASPANASSGTAGSLPDVSQPGGREQDSGRKPRLMRTQSAFSPVVFGPLFTGETVSLVDVDISQRGLTSPHPPTPPPPPRRSLSLLDDISGTLPTSVLVGPMGSSSLQSFPLPPPPPPHAPDAFPRIIPIRAPEAVHSQPAQHLQCPLYRPDSSSFAASLRELEKCGWYWGPMNWEDAEMKLKGKPDGSFLVRDSSDPRYILSLSFRSQGITHHTRMEHYRGTFSLWCHPKFEDRCQSVVEFIKRAIMHSKNGKFLYFLRSRVPGLPPTPVQLLYPVSRFSNVKSLQHLCRFRIRQLVRIDHIPELPLPKPLISYIRKFYYYDPQEEVYLSLKEAQLVSKQKQEMESST